MLRSPVINPRHLMWEVRCGDVEKASTILDAFGVHFLEEWAAGYNLLRLALEWNRTHLAKVILSKGASIHGGKRREPAETLLHSAARCGDPEVVKMLLDRGANINAKDRFGETPLHYAARSSVEVVRVLLARNASIHVQDNRGLTALSTAITKHNLEVVEEFLKHFRKLNNYGKPDLNSLLCVAAEWSNTDMVALLLKNSTEVNFQEEHEESPLHSAAKHGQHEIIKVLINTGANINMPDKMGKTVLHAAVQSAHHDEDSCVYRPYLYTVKTILSYRPDVRNEMNRLTLSEAITEHNCKKESKSNCRMIPVVDALLRYGITVRSEDAEDSVFVYKSIRHGMVKIIDAVLNLGIDVNTMYKMRNGDIEEMTLLHMAVECDQYEVAEFLVCKGADAHLRDSNGSQVICFAIGEGRDTIAKMLMSTSTMSAELWAEYLRYAVTHVRPSVVRMMLDTYPQIDVNWADDVYGFTALHWAVAMESEPVSTTPELEIEDIERFEKARLSIVEILLSAGASTDLKATPDGVTPLLYAVSEGHTRIVRELLNHGADVNCPESHGLTPIYEAARKADYGIAKILLHYSADVNSKLPCGKTVIHAACESGNVDLVKFLCQADCKVNVKDGKGATALHYATMYGHTMVVRTLIKYGANVNAKNIYGRTPLHGAAFHSWSTVAIILLKNGADTLARSNDDKLPIAYAQHDDLDLEHQHANGMIQEDLPDMELDGENYKLHVSAYEYFCDRQCRGKVFKSIEKFQLEAERMKNVEIGQSSVTFHDILVCSKKKLLLYARNQCIVDAFESQISEFPRHRGIVQRRFQEAEKKNSQLTQTLTSLDTLTGNVFPPEIREMFVVFLNDQDMKNVKIASDLPPA